MSIQSPEAFTILLVEDNPDDEELTLLAFKSSTLSNNLITVHDGAEALDFLFRTGKYSERDSRSNPRLVLLDLKLPKIGGLDVLRKMRANPATQFLPVVVLTTSNQDEDIIDSYRFGANSYIRKPVEFKNFCKAIEQLGLYWLSLNEVPLSLSISS